MHSGSVIPFIEKGILLLKLNGMISYITPSMFIKRDFGKEIRKLILENVSVSKLVYFGDFQIFGKVTNYPLIFVFEKKEKQSKIIEIINFKTQKGLNHTLVNNSLMNIDTDEFSAKYAISNNNITIDNWNLSNESFNDIKNKIENNNNVIRLKEITEYIFEGIASGKDEVFYISDDIIKNYRIEKGIISPLFKGKDINTYFANWSKKFVIYPYDKNTNKVIDENQMKIIYPNAYKYFQDNKELLKGRPYFDNSNKIWYELWNERNYKKFQNLKIVVAEISSDNRFYLDDKGFLGNTKTFHIVLKKNWIDEYKFVLGILNSRLLEFYHKLISVPKAGGFFEYKTQFLNLYPIRKIDFENKKEKAQHDRIVSLVEQMLELNKKVRTLQGHEKTVVERQIVSNDHQIDKLVYELYALTDDEIKVVEGE